MPRIKVIIIRMNPNFISFNVKLHILIIPKQKVRIKNNVSAIPIFILALFLLMI